LFSKIYKTVLQNLFLLILEQLYIPASNYYSCQNSEPHLLS
jgi:hypothetical protein